jgi:hypothetical protein
MNLDQLETYMATVNPVPLVAGLVFLLLGWILYWSSVNLLGALILGGLGLVIAEGVHILFPDLTAMQVIMLRGVGIIGGAVTGLFVARMVHRLAFFIFGWMLGAVGFFKGYLAACKHLEMEPNDLVLAFGTPIAGLLLGMIVVKMDRWLSIIATSLIGALLVTSGVNDWQAPILMPALCGLGILFQGAICSLKKREPKKSSD